MNQRQKDCILEVQELLLSINETVKKYDLQNEFLSVIAVGFLDMSTTFRDDDGNERADMNLLSTFTVSDEDELDDSKWYGSDPEFTFPEMEPILTKIES
jgi:hypothetical protein